MAFVKVAEISEITAGSKKKVVAEGKEILLANVNGTYYALSDKCPHMGGSLSEGKLEGTSIICPRHGATFNVTNGSVVKNPKILFISMQVKEAVGYVTKVEGSDILVDIT